MLLTWICSQIVVGMHFVCVFVADMRRLIISFWRVNYHTGSVNELILIVASSLAGHRRHLKISYLLKLKQEHFSAHKQNP